MCVLRSVLTYCCSDSYISIPPRRFQDDDIDTILKHISASSSPRRIRLRAQRVGRKHTTINASTRRTATRPRHPSTRQLESHSPVPHLSFPSLPLAAGAAWRVL